MSVTLGGTPTGTSLEGGGISSLTVAHTAAGTNRAAWFAVGCSAGSPPTGITATYGGNAMTAAYALLNGGAFHANRAFSIAGDANVLASSVNAVASFTGNTADEAHISVISMRDVDSVTPVGAAVTSVANINNTPSVTVGSVGSGDMVVDCLYAGGGETLAGSGPGANQTLAFESTDASTDYHGSSYQAGSDGGVMSWTLDATPSFGTTLGAIAFKPAASGGSVGLATLGAGS